MNFAMSIFYTNTLTCKSAFLKIEISLITSRQIKMRWNVILVVCIYHVNSIL